MVSLEYYKVEGVKARQRGWKRSDCDYDSLTYDEADWWQAGWDQENERQLKKVYHPLRCETCDHGTKLTLDASKCPVGDPYPNVYACAKQEGKWMPTAEDGNSIAIVGCVSHSNSRKVDDVLEKLELLGKMLPTIPNSAICDKEALLYIPACTVNKMNKIIGDLMRSEISYLRFGGCKNDET